MKVIVLVGIQTQKIGDSDSLENFMKEKLSFKDKDVGLGKPRHFSLLFQFHF